ncbi:unnamed protein product [Rotaria magnacalcarata]|uniref:RING-type domain-containing protein n=5 Tax=Rotaria TaxID=231623 RepID=A0A815CUS2_9BILA|nr:unnamed protein product [Rotaria magnacalcarata]CAF2178442.1 unnamed protein product [Rotaria magnacalcarata]
MIPSKKQTLDLINEHLTCRLCSGYLIDAWTINECLHSFCRSCIFSYFNDNDENTACPVCSTVPHPANPLLGVTKDCWLQQIVYKLVPSLFKREMCQRRTYYDSNPDSKAKLLEQYSKTLPSQMGCREEELGELSERCLFQQKNKLNNKENIYVTLEYNESDLKDFQANLHLFFIECSSNMPINILKQYLKKVLPLSKRTRYQIDVLYEQKVLLDSLTLNHIYSWKQSKQPKCKQLHLFYRVIIIEREENESLIKIEQENDANLEPVTSSIFNLAPSFDDNNPPTRVLPKPAPFIRATTNIYSNPNSFVHTTPFSPAEARTISLNNSITEQFHGNETKELIKPKECTLLDCKTFAITTPINYSMNSIGDISQSKKRPKKSNLNDRSLTKKPKPERKKKIKEEKTIRPLLPSNTSMIPLNSSPSENENPNEIVEQKQLSYSEVIQEANKLLAADEPSTPINNSLSSSSSISLTNPVTSRLTKPIATVSPLHTSKTNQNKSDDDQLIDLSKSNVTLAEVPLKLETQTEGTKKRSRRTSSSTTRTKISRHSHKSTSDEGNDVTKSLKKTHSNMNPTQFLPPPPATQQQMFQNLFHSFQNQANYWPMTPWPVPPSLALMADPRNYYAQPWSHQSSVAHAPKDLSSASLNDFIGETSNPNFTLPPASALLNSASNFSRTSSSSSLHLHHATSRHRPTTLNGTLS